MTRRYGLPREPESREFGYIEDGTLKTFVFHPRMDMGFDEVVEFGRLRQRWNNGIQEDAKAFSDGLRALTAERNARKDEEGNDIVDLTDEEFEARAAALEQEYTDKERERYLAKVELVLFLVHEHDRDAFRPILARSHPDDLNTLLTGLRDEVVTRTAKNVEEAMGVDPSLPASPSA